MRPITAAAVLAPSLAIGLAARGPAQSLTPQDLPVFGTGVQVVAVPVFVTDKSGRAVGGLTAADFDVEDQKRSVKVVAFEAVDASAPGPPAPNAGPLVQAAARRQLLFLFDLTFSSPVGLMKARDAATSLVRTNLAPGDLAAAATYGQSGVRILVGFTSDRGQLARAIEGLGLLDTPQSRDPFHLAWDLGLDLTRYAGDSSFPLPEQLVEQLRMLSRAESALYRQRVDSFIGGLGQLGQMLDGLQGRKHVLLLSAGFDQTVLLGEQGREQRESAQAIAEGRVFDVQGDRYFGDAKAREELQRLYQALGASDTVIHTIDVTGLAAAGSVEHAGWTRGRETLASLALNTGGRFVRDANDLAAGLKEVLDATRYYYVLAFEPSDRRGNGKLRKLSVKVKREGLSVSHRAGYFLHDPDRAKDSVAWQVQAAETIAKGLSGGPLGLRAVAIPYRDTTGHTRLAAVLEIDGGSLVATCGEEAKLEVYGYALDGAGRIYDVLAVSPAFDAGKAGASLRARGLQVITSFAVPDGPADLRFLVRDAVSGRAGSLRVQTLVPSFEDRGLALSPPLFVDDPRTRLVVAAPSRANPALEIPFRLGERPFTVDVLPTLARGRSREVCVIAWSGGRDRESPSYDVRAELVGLDGSHPVAVAGSVRVVRDADGFERFLMTVEPGAAPAGDYTLRVSFGDPTTGTVRSTEAPVRVE